MSIQTPTVQCDIYIPGRYAPLIHRHLRQLIPNARRLIVTRNARRWRGRGHPAVPTNRTARWIGQRSAGSLSCTANRYLCSTPPPQERALSHTPCKDLLLLLFWFRTIASKRNGFSPSRGHSGGGGEGAPYCRTLSPCRCISWLG